MSDSTQHRSRRTSRLALSIVATGLLLITTVATVAAASPRTSTAPGAGTATPWSDGALRIRPNPKVVDLHPQAWDHVTLSAVGQRLVVYFWMGPKACNGLGRVDLARHDGQLDIQLWTGIPPHKIGFVCPEYAQLYKTVIHLDRPIITGGPIAVD